ncbi:MAG: hypothetical protein SCK28_06990 [Bacillota bacterium]|nr:hypothetical protein [Bacillota bacterium]
MKLVKIAAVYSIIVGVSIIGIWAMLYLNNEIPELNITPIAITMHLAAEILTALLLIVGGIGLLLKRWWGYQIYLFSMGMLVYTLIQSPGYYAEKGNLAFVIMFAVILIISLSFLMLSFMKKEHFAALGDKYGN